MSGGRKPDYSVGALNRDTDEKNPKVGAAWCNDDGSIDININDFVVIRGSKATYLRLFPYRERSASVPPPTPQEEPKQPYTTKDLQDDIPF